MSRTISNMTRANGESARPDVVADGSRSTMLRRVPSWLRVLSGRIAVGVVLVGVWQAAVTLGWIDPLVARSPHEVWDALTLLIEEGVLWPNVVATLSATVIAFVLASIVGIIAGIGLGLVPKLEALVDPYVSAFNSMPRIAFAPIFIIYFGIDQSAKIALAFTLVVFIMLVNSRAGIKAADPDVLTLATVMNASKLQLFFKVMLPSAVPSIFAGVRLSVVYALLGVVASEIIAARDGLGQLIAQYSGVFQLESVYAVVLVLMVIGLVINSLMGAAERYLLRWQSDAGRS